MSLITQMAENWHKMVKTTQPNPDDPFAGDTPQWIQGDAFSASISKRSTTQALIAQAQYAIGNYLISPITEIQLNKNDFIRRDSDLFVLKITEPNNNSKPPEFSKITPFSQAMGTEAFLV